MENIILTNNKDLRLVGVKVGVLSTLRFELPLVSASATHVEVIVTSGDVHSAYTATFIPDTKRWQCDIAASQFPTVGKQSYEIAYVLDGKQFWDGKGWIEIEDATTSGIEPQPRPEPYRYAVVSVNGYGADAQGAVRIPKTFIATDSPTTTEGYMEGDIYFCRETGATWTLCNVQGTLTWVFNYKNYYTKQETDEAIDRVAAYYITYDAAGNPFPTYASLANATTVYSGGSVRVPTRNDYCVVLADETHQGAEYRYIYSVAEGQTTGSWQPQFPVEGVMTVDPTVTRNSQNPVSGGGVWSAIWGALSALPAGFASLYDWCVAQLAGKASKSDVDPLLFAQYYPDGSVKSAAEFTPGIKYDAPDTTNRTITVKPFCNTGDSANDNSGLVGRVVIPPFVDAQGNPYISDDGTRYKVVGVSGGSSSGDNTNLTAIVAPNTVTTIGDRVFNACTALTFVSFPAAMDIGGNAFRGDTALTSVSLPAATTVEGSALRDCIALTSVSLPAATTIGDRVFSACTALTSVSLPAAQSIGGNAFSYCTSLDSVDFGATPRASVPSLGTGAFYGVPTSCKIIVPYAQYDAWKAASGWSTLPQEFVRHSEKADKPATFTAGNLAALDANGNPTDSGKSFEDVQSQIDTESPLLARSFAVQRQSGWREASGATGTAGNSVIFFRPRYFGMKDGDLFKGIVLQTRADQRTVFSNGVYMRLRAVPADQSAPWPTLGVSELTVWPDTPKTDVVFRLPRAVSLPSSGSYYALDFVLDPAGGTQAFGMMAYGLQSGSNPDFYFALSTIVPVATAQFYSWEELTGADIAVSGTDATKINAALAGKLDKSGGTVTGTLQIGDNSAENIILNPSDATITVEYIKNNYSSDSCYVPNGPGTLALAAANPTAGNLAALDANGNPTDSTIPAAHVALKSAIPYTLGTPIVINTASSETVEGETVNYGAATLADRTANVVQVTAATALDELRITFPAATSGKVRDFGLRVEIGTGSAALTAPALVPIAPTGETIKIENADGTIPELADGTATAKGVTLLYFSENAPGVFVVKGEQVEEVA